MGESSTRWAERLVRCYPAEWRARYGDEFVEMLLADVEERPRSLGRTLDVAGHGLFARMKALGLAGESLAPSEQAHSSLASFGCAFGAFAVFGVAIWAQLTIGWEWSEPNTAGTVLAMVIMSVAVLLLTVLALFASLPLMAAAVRAVRRGRGRTILWPAICLFAGVAILAVGGHHFANGWPGTHGHPWEHQGIVPGGVAAFSWASTLSVSAYWAHPQALGAFPVQEIAWMLVSPLAIVSVIAGAAKIVRRVDLGPGALRFELRLAQAASAVMVLFVTGACLWVVRGGPGPRNLFHTGVIDVAGLVAMVTALGLAYRSTKRAPSGRHLLA
jgi:hypothetical protein